MMKFICVRILGTMECLLFPFHWAWQTRPEPLPLHSVSNLRLERKKDMLVLEHALPEYISGGTWMPVFDSPSFYWSYILGKQIFVKFDKTWNRTEVQCMWFYLYLPQTSKCQQYFIKTMFVFSYFCLDHTNATENMQTQQADSLSCAFWPS